MKCEKEDCKGSTTLKQTKDYAIIMCDTCSWTLQILGGKERTVKYFIDNGGVEDGS